MLPTPLLDEATLARACGLLAAGQLVAFPTETVYGLGADALNPLAIQRIYALKGRPANHPLIVHVARWADVTRLAASIPAPLQQLTEAFWPGPLTIIVPKTTLVPSAATGGQATVGIRWPVHPVAQQVLQAYANPLVAPSANRYQHVSPTTAAHVRGDFPDTDALPLVLDGGDCEVGLESTIVGWDDATHTVQLLRPGHITPDAMQAVLGDSVPIVDVSTLPAARAEKVSGQEARHYCPQTPVILVENPAKLPSGVEAHQCALLAWDSTQPGWEALAKQAKAVLPVGETPLQYAKHLYATLRHADTLNTTTLLLQPPPNTPDWATVWNRLQRLVK